MSLLPDRIWTTRELTADLAERLRRPPERFLVACEATVCERPAARADLLCMRRKLSEQPMLICEVKVSRGDLLSDLKSEKWRAYLKVAAVAFAFPAELAMASEIPVDAGLIVRTARGWRWERPPVYFRAPLPSAYLYRRMALTASDQAAGMALTSGGDIKRDAFGDERPAPLQEPG